MMDRTQSVWFIGLAGASALLLAACGGGGGGGGNSNNEEEDSSGNTTADANPSVSFFTSDTGGLGIRANGVDSGDGNVTKPKVKNVTIEEGDTAEGTASGATVSAAEIETTCTDLETGEAGAGDRFDIGVSLDTTGSMGGAASVLATHVADFATDLEAAGLDVRFTGVTLGDAYATKNDPSAYEDSVSTGTLGEPPEFDSNERPDTGTALVSASDMETFFSEVADAIHGAGVGGGDGAENYLGAAERLHDQAEWRTDAGRFIIGIGDFLAHTQTTFEASGTISGSDGYETWLPPKTDNLIDAFVRDGTAFHWVGTPDLSDLSDSSDFECDEEILGEEYCADYEDLIAGQDFYNMKDLAAATGGVFTEIGDCQTTEDCEVELTALPAVEAVTTARTTTACEIDIPDGVDKVTTRFDLEAGDAGWRVTAVHSVGTGDEGKYETDSVTYER